MVLLPNPTVDAIFATYVEANKKEARREYLGCSELGHECSRRLWYSFRWCGQEDLSGRILRLFDTGKREEDRIIVDLRASDVTVHDRDPQGNQWRYHACDGHMSGGLDGVVVGVKEAPETPHLLEVKTHNQKSFDDLEKHGVEKSKPVHFAQMQLYMGMAELSRALYLAVNKNTDEIHNERLEYDSAVFKALLLKASRIIKAETPPDKLSQDPSFYICKYCPHHGLCHGDTRPEVDHCRTCVHSSPVADGRWSCGRSLAMQPKCTEHIIIPGLLPWAKPIDGSPDHIVYELPSGQRFANVAGTFFDPSLPYPMYSSAELAVVPVAAIGNVAVEAVRKELGGRVVPT